MIILRKGRTMKVLRVQLEQIYVADVSIKDIRLQLIHVSPQEIQKMRESHPVLNRPIYFSLTQPNRIDVYPTPDRDYRCHITGTTLVIL